MTDKKADSKQTIDDKGIDKKKETTQTNKEINIENPYRRIVRIPWYISNYRTIIDSVFPVSLFGVVISTVASPRWVAVSSWAVCTFTMFFCMVESKKWKSQQEVEDAYRKRFEN